MALLICQNCGGKVSDKAKSCPHCGELNQPINSELFEHSAVKGNVEILQQRVTDASIHHRIMESSSIMTKAVKMSTKAIASYKENGYHRGGNENIEQFAQLESEVMWCFERVVNIWESIVNDLKNISIIGYNDPIQQAMFARKEMLKKHLPRVERDMIVCQKFVESLKPALENENVGKALSHLICIMQDQIQARNKYIQLIKEFLSLELPIS